MGMVCAAHYGEVAVGLEFYPSVITAPYYYSRTVVPTTPLTFRLGPLAPHADAHHSASWPLFCVLQPQATHTTWWRAWVAVVKCNAMCRQGGGGVRWAAAGEAPTQNVNVMATATGTSDTTCQVSRHTHIHARTQVKTVLLVLASYSSFYVAEHIVGTSGVSMPRDSGRAGWVGGPSRLSSNHCFVVNRSLLS